jgi:hypothetical protein
LDPDISWRSQIASSRLTMLQKYSRNNRFHCNCNAESLSIGEARCCLLCWTRFAAERLVYAIVLCWPNYRRRRPINSMRRPQNSAEPHISGYVWLCWHRSYFDVAAWKLKPHATSCIGWTSDTPKLILYKMHMLYVYKMLFRDSFYRGLAWPSIKCPSRASYFIIL